MGTERDSIDRKTFTEGDSYSITTMASLASPDGNMSSVGQWNLTNSANQAVFTATTGLFDGIASPSTDTHGSSRAYSQLWVFFTLTEEVRFSITGNILYSGLLNPDYSGFGNVGVGLYRDGAWYYETNGFVRNTAGHAKLGENSSHFSGKSTGIIGPGDYRFLVTSSVANGVGTGHVAMTLSVPDGGSTLALFGMAVAALGGLKRRIG